MDVRRLVPAALIMTIAAGAEAAQPLPEAVARMIRAAPPAQLETVAALARQTQPDSVAEIDRLVGQIRAAYDAEQKRQQAIATRGLMNGWGGEASVGATLTTGNTRQRGAAGKLELVKQGLRWRHRLYGEADVQESEGERTRERYAASYQADHRFSPRFYTYGFLGWESDRFAGFDRRFTESAGLGWLPIETSRLRVSLEGGPALRQTTFTRDDDDPDTDLNDNELNLRGRTNIRWVIIGDLVFTEEAGFLVGNGNDTLFANSALTTTLIGNLSTRVSFDVKHETDPPEGKVKTDTVTRASLVYKF